MKLRFLKFLLPGLLFSCSAAVQEKPAVEVKEEKPQDVYRERIKRDFEEFLRRARGG